MGSGKCPNAGGEQPRWRSDGKELFYLAPDGKIMAMPVTIGASFDAGAPVALFQANPSRNDRNVGTVRLRRKQRRSEILDQHAAEIGTDTNVSSDELDCQPEQIDRALELPNKSTQLLKSGHSAHDLDGLGFWADDVQHFHT